MKEVIVSVKGRNGPGDEGHMELITEGKLYKEDNSFCISYNETGVTGMDGTITTLKVEENRVTLIRKGTISSTFIFEEGVENISHYATEYGVFTVGVKADRIESAIDEFGGVVAVSYSLDMVDKTHNDFVLTVREVNNDRYSS